MTKILQILLAGLVVFMVLLLQTREDYELFYIISSMNSNPNCSDNRSCLTFKQYVNSFHPQENITLVFLTGYHTFTVGQYIPEDPDFYFVQNTNFTMVGISTEVIIHDVAMMFLDVHKLQIENLTLNNGLFFT